MSESSTDKTKRKLIKILQTYDFNYQYSVFFNEINDRQEIISEIRLLKEQVRRRHKNIPILFQLRHKKHTDIQKYGEFTFFITFFSTEPLNKFPEINYPIRERKLHDGKIESTINSIKKQKLHQINLVIGHELKRYGIFNCR